MDYDFKIEPRPYQQRITKQLVKMFRGEFVRPNGQAEPDIDSVMIESPTGSGKTVMGLVGSRYMQDEFGCHVVWSAMRRNLLKQAERENIEKNTGVNATFQSMFDKHVPEHLLATKRDRPLLLVVDECQHDATDSMAYIHGSLKPDYVIGLSATPYRTDKVQLCFQKVIKDAGIHELIEGGYLSPYHHYSVPRWKPDILAERYLAEPDRWGKSLFFFHTQEQCDEMEDLLLRGGVTAEVVNGKSSFAFRQEQLDRFEHDETTVLINMAILTEGFDAPSLRTVWIRDSVKGLTTQMGGRVFRKHPEIEFKQVVQSEMTKNPFVKIARPEMSHVWKDGKWLSLTPNKAVDQIAKRSMLFIARSQPDIPSFLTEKGVRKFKPDAED